MFGAHTPYHGVELGQVSCGKQTFFGVEFNVRKVRCIHFFRTISIKTKV